MRWLGSDNGKLAHLRKLLVNLLLELFVLELFGGRSNNVSFLYEAVPSTAKRPRAHRNVAVHGERLEVGEQVAEVAHL